MIESPHGQSSGRARRLPSGERRAMIIHAITPLLLEHGRDVTTRQIAEAAGIAEGTIYRAFGDKESLVDAAIAHYLDPEPLRCRLREIDPALPLEDKIGAIVEALRTRFTAVFRIMAVLGAERPPTPRQPHAYFEIISECLAPDGAALNWPPDQVAQFIRMVTFSSVFPQLNDGMEFTTEQLTSIILSGVAGSAPAAHTRERS